MNPIKTKGPLVVNDLKVHDIHAELQQCGIAVCRVLTLPSRDAHGYWSWQAQRLNLDGSDDGNTAVTYGVHEDYPQYAPELYPIDMVKFNVWNGTDGIYANYEPFNTYQEAAQFITDFPKRYEKQGYYKTNRWEQIDPKDVLLSIHFTIIEPEEEDNDEPFDQEPLF